MTGTGLGHSGISFKNCRRHSAFSPSLSKAINFDPIVERAMYVCLKDFKDTVVHPSVNTYVLVDFDSSKSAIQFASLYPLSTGEYFPYLNASYSLVLDT